MDDLLKLSDMTGNVFHQIWSYCLVTVSGNHIKVSNIILAAILFMLGLRLSTRFSDFVRSYIQKRFDKDKDAANALEKIVKYLAFCLYAITILEIANVPMSTFAFIGGALAIGIGLGAQTLIGNFIGGIIIMIEKTVKIGDIIEIEGVTGSVTSVGARCVIVNTFSNVEVLIPNNKIIQNTLVNWTLSNSNVRYQIEIKINKTKDDYAKAKDFIKILEDVIKESDFIHVKQNSNANLIKIEDSHLIFLINFFCDICRVQNPEIIKSLFNMILLQKLVGYDFSVNYCNVVDVKASSSKEDK